jgi:hypothetical protein
MHLHITNLVVTCFKPSLHHPLHRLILCFITITIIVFLYFCFNFNEIHAYNQPSSKFTKSHSTRYSNNCRSQINDTNQWQYKNGVHGTWHCWSIQNPILGTSQTSMYLIGCYKSLTISNSFR